MFPTLPLPALGGRLKRVKLGWKKVFLGITFPVFWFLILEIWSDVIQ